MYFALKQIHKTQTNSLNSWLMSYKRNEERIINMKCFLKFRNSVFLCTYDRINQTHKRFEFHVYLADILQYHE